MNASGAIGNDSTVPLRYNDDDIEAHCVACPGAPISGLVGVIASFAPWVLRVTPDVLRNTLSHLPSARASDVQTGEPERGRRNDTTLPLGNDEDDIEAYWVVRPGAAISRLVDAVA